MEDDKRSTLSSLQPVRRAALAAARATTQTRDRGWWLAGLCFCLFMLAVHVVAGLNTAGVPDYWRDMYWAAAIARGERLPLAGPQIYELIEVGPWWWYLLAVPMALTGSVAMASAFVQVLAAMKYLLAWRLGLRVDARLGLAFAVSLAVAGWSMVPIMFPSHTALVETTLLVLAMVVWRCWSQLSLRNAILLGLTWAACLHAHPTTASYVALSGLVLLVRDISATAFARLGVATAIAALSLLPPWLAPDAAVAGALKPVSEYVGGDFAVHTLQRAPALLNGLVAGGAWWSLLLYTRWSVGAVKLAWWLHCACLLGAAGGLLCQRRRDRRLWRVGLVAAGLFVAQVLVLLLVRPITPMWMVSSCLPPLALLIAIGWHGWLRDARAALRTAAAVGLGVGVAVALAPYAIWMRDLHSVRVMQDANPMRDAIESSDRYHGVTVPFYPARRLDRLARELCGPTVLHGRLAAVVEASFATPLRNACGTWPELRYGGVEGRGRHVAGLLPRAATATGIPPDRVVARMALYERVRAIAPAIGGRFAPLRRLQIVPDSGRSPPQRSIFGFSAAGGDVVVLTNRMPHSAPLQVHAIRADGREAQLRHDDGSSRVYACADCAAQKAVPWQVEVEGIVENLDLVVLLHTTDGASVAAPDRPPAPQRR